jgi:hypothetical protein
VDGNTIPTDVVASSNGAAALTSIVGGEASAQMGDVAVSATGASVLTPIVGGEASAQEGDVMVAGNRVSALTAPENLPGTPSAGAAGSDDGHMGGKEDNVVVPAVGTEGQLKMKKLRELQLAEPTRKAQIAAALAALLQDKDDGNFGISMLHIPDSNESDEWEMMEEERQEMLDDPEANNEQ